jgi:hypothetical protein
MFGILAALFTECVEKVLEILFIIHPRDDYFKAATAVPAI